MSLKLSVVSPAKDLLDEIVDSDIDYQDYEALNLDTVIASPKARDLIFCALSVTSTVDHIIQASECKRGGKYIAPCCDCSVVT